MDVKNHKTSTISESNSGQLIKTTKMSDGRAEDRQSKFNSYKRMVNNRTAKMKYLWKPLVFVSIGLTLNCFGIVLTTLHFMHELDVDHNVEIPPYFTFGPIALASGMVTFMIGIIWFSIKLRKWNNGSATPISKAVAVAGHLVANAAFTEKIGMVPRSL